MFRTSRYSSNFEETSDDNKKDRNHKVLREKMIITVNENTSCENKGTTQKTNIKWKLGSDSGHMSFGFKANMAVVEAFTRCRVLKLQEFSSRYEPIQAHCRV